MAKYKVQNPKLTLSQSNARMVVAILSAIVAALTFVLENVNMIDPTFTLPIIIGAVIAFFVAIMKFVTPAANIPPAPTPTTPTTA